MIYHLTRLTALILFNLLCVVFVPLGFLCGAIRLGFGAGLDLFDKACTWMLPLRKDSK